MMRQHQSALGLLRLLLIGSVAVPAVLTAMLAWLTYRADVDQSLREAVWTSGIAREHASRVFDTQQLVIERVIDLLKDMDDETVRASEASLHDKLQSILSDLSKHLSIVVTDKAGLLLLSSSLYPVERSLDLSDREYFRALAKAPMARVVSEVQTSRLDGHIFFGLARSRLDGEHHFNGVVNIAISPMLFTSFYNTLVKQDERTDGGRVLAMIRDDGKPLVRYPRPPPAQLAVPASNPFFAAVEHSPDHGTYRAKSLVGVDGPMRLYAYDRVQGYPLYIVAGHSLDTIREVWLARMLRYLAGIVPATAALFAVTLVTIGRTRREKQALAQAQDEIGRRERAEAALHRAQRLEAVGQLTGGIAHDFNNLLTIIVGNVDMMVRRAEDPDRVRRLGGNVLLAAKRVADVTDKLLAFSRRTVVRLEVVDLNDLIEEMRPLLIQAVSRSVEVAFDFAEVPCPVDIDPGQFEAAVINLVVNARDAMPDGGSLSISTRRKDLAPAEVTDGPDLAPGPYVMVTVRDSGSGMDAATLAKAFEPFFTTKDVGRGTGLGLSQVYGFSKQAGGHVRIESLPGAGTCVEILLPRSAEEPVAERSRSDLPTPVRSRHRETVLVVEDEPSLRDMAIESLEDLGYRTVSAGDAAQALARLADGTAIDIMFSDIVMPGGMDGIGLMREAKRLRPDLPIVLTSGYTDAGGGDAIPGDVPLLRKPYMREDLASEIGRLLARRVPVPN